MGEQNKNYAIIPHVNLPAVLMLETIDGWTLPQYQATRIPAIIRTFKEQMELAVTVLYCAYDRYEDDEESEQIYRIYALENHSLDWTPPANGRWVWQTELATLGIVEAEQRAVLEMWFRDLDESSISEQRRPWLRPGWFAAACAWIDTQLKLADYRQVGEVEQVHSTHWSCVLCVKTTQGSLYFKASEPIFVLEPRFTEALAKIAPVAIPQVVAVDQERGWMLMRDAGTLLASKPERKKDLATWKKVLVRFAGLQIQCATHNAELLAQGCADWRLEGMPVLFAEAFADTAALLVGQKGGLTTEEFAQLAAMQSELPALCAKLASYNMPETIHHDDLHGNNIALSGEGDDEGVVFFDWAESGLAHPFFTMVVVMRVARYVCEFDQEQMEQLRDAYLAPWLQFEPAIERLHEAFELAQRLGKLRRALTWYRFVRCTEQRFRQGYAGSWPYWLQVFMGTQE